MSRPLHRHPAVHGARPRLAVVSVLAVLFAVGTHLAAGGTVMPAADILVVAAVLAGSSTWLAEQVGRRTRGMAAAAAAVGAGQGGLDLLLRATGQSVRDPLLAAGLHAGATIVLVILVLGVERVVADLSAVVDRSLPAVCWSRGPSAASSGAVVRAVGDADDAVARWLPARCPARGPPLPP